MCTAATYLTNDFYFGRTLDYEFSYGDEITITPENFPFRFRCGKNIDSHYALIGMAHVVEDYPLYYDAVNSKGLAMAGLNFVGNAVYHESAPDKDNIAQFEFIAWI
ncbi:MAG: linear amide C-N hydrolase, partial [Oscillospiraceae bacterium]|nr:linear amide C-N hydrolase [Oscillospiraceae bacterium]